MIFDVGTSAIRTRSSRPARPHRTLRQEGGLSGFNPPRESEYDPFGAAHSSTSISAGTGHGGSGRAEQDRPQGDRADRRRLDVGGHGFRGAQQRRRAGRTADRHPQRQRTCRLPADGRDERLSGAARLGAHLFGFRDLGKKLNRLSRQEGRPCHHPRRRACARLCDGRHAVRGARLLHIGPIDGHSSTICCRCCAMSATTPPVRC